MSSLLPEVSLWCIRVVGPVASLEYACVLQAEGRELKKVQAGNHQAAEELRDQEARLQQMAVEAEAARQEVARRIQAITEKEVIFAAPGLSLNPKPHLLASIINVMPAAMHL